MTVEQAAAAIRAGEALVVTAGAGMGVDSGLPDFRGTEGFWNAYPPFRALGLAFSDLARPSWFRADPALAWGFYGHRAALYRRTVPHRGFGILRRWMEAAPSGGRVFTSNVDGQFQTAGFAEEQIVECHGSIHHLQCERPCSNALWSSSYEATWDEASMRANAPFPLCPDCGAVARPAILMFADGGWVSSRTDEQDDALRSFLEARDLRRTVVIECGAGSSIPTVRGFGEALLAHGAALVRINPRESDGPPGTISLTGGALHLLEAIDALI